MDDKRRWERLLEWLRDKHGMDVSEKGLKVEGRGAPGAGRGLFALQPCSPSESLFTIPAKAMVNIKTLKSLYPPTLSPVQMISLHLLLHKPVGDEESNDPMFGPYISTLPREFGSHPLTWMGQADGQSLAEKSLSNSLPPSSQSALRNLTMRFERDWEAIRKYVCSNPDIDSLSSRQSLRSLVETVGSSNVLLNDYRWAWLNVNTRSIYYRLDLTSSSSPSNVTLCPILDFANHTPVQTEIVPILPSCTQSTLPAKKPKAKIGGDYSFKLSDQTSLKKDQEVFLRYGGHSNRTLFVEYGFVERPESVADIYVLGAEVDVQDLVEELFEGVANRGAQMKEILENAGYWGDWVLYIDPQPAHPSYRLINALRLYHLCSEQDCDADFEKALKRWRAVMEGYSERVSDENERRWRSTLLEMCDRISERGREGVKKVDEVRDAASTCEWLGWMKENIRRLWMEEVEVSRCVAASIRSNVEF